MYFRFCLIILTLASGLCAESVQWEKEGDILQFRFNTSELSGVFVAQDASDYSFPVARHGLRQIRFKITDEDVHPEGFRARQGHLNLYRLYAGEKSLGSLRDELPAVEQLDDGARLTWPATGVRAARVEATWRLTGPAQIDLEIKVTATRDMEKVEILPAVYCPPLMEKYVCLEREGLHVGVPAPPPAEGEGPNDYPYFPLSEIDRQAQLLSGRLTSDWKWLTALQPENAALPITWSNNGTTEILLMGDPESTSAVSATPRPNSPEPKAWSSLERHSALYLSLFCRDLKAGQSLTSHTRLVYRQINHPGMADRVKRYREFVEQFDTNQW